MIAKISRGSSTAGLMGYLFGEGKSNEHTDQHVVSGDAGVRAAFVDNGTDGNTHLDLALYLDAPMKMFGTKVTVADQRWDPERGENVSVGRKAAHVWHCSLAIKADEGPLSDRQWSDIARDFVAQMGFDSDNADEAACRWVAVRHGLSSAGNDHIHIAVNLVREDGTKASTHKDYVRASKACNSIEHRFGLGVLLSREDERAKPRGVSAAELARATSTGAAPERDELRRRLRTASTMAANESDFIARAHEMRVLLRPRYEKGTRDKVVGYSAALPVAGDAPVVWHGGGRLERALALGQMRARWGQSDADEQAALQHWQSSRSRNASNSKARLPRLSMETVSRLNAHGQNVVPDRRNLVGRFAAVDLSGAFAHASITFEREAHGAFAVASDTFARAAAPTRPGVRGPSSRQSAEFMNAYSIRLMQRGIGRDERAGWIAVFRQMQRLGKAIEVAEREMGRADSAARIAHALAASDAQIQRITPRLPASLEQPQTNSYRAPGVDREPGRE